MIRVTLSVFVLASPTIKLLVEDPIVANPGQTVILVCIISGGEPTPTLTWVRNTEELPKKSILKSDTLTIPAISTEDAGVYSCVASNNVGNPAKKSTNIVVRALKKGRFWITPDPYHNDDNIQIGREVKISCQVEATPPEELMFSWLKNGRPLRSSERMVITQTDPDVAPGITNLDIIDLKFTDFGTYTCVASLKNGGIPEISIDVNISSTTEVMLNQPADARSLSHQAPCSCNRKYIQHCSPLFFFFVLYSLPSLHINLSFPLTLCRRENRFVFYLQWRKNVFFSHCTVFICLCHHLSYPTSHMCMIGFIMTVRFLY
uniref:MAM domain containing glycosylphosphatidylinositol anchor 2a n=1 Tax=Cyprinus carpio carpio TaxID=630221 RepID=A0A8C1I4H5_CYPCA